MRRRGAGPGRSHRSGGRFCGKHPPVHARHKQQLGTLHAAVSSSGDDSGESLSNPRRHGSPRFPASVMLAARVNLKGWQQAAVAVGSAFGALLDPKRADLIAALGETTGKPAFERVLQRMKNSAEGRFMGSRNFSPDDRPPVRFMETDDLAFVATRAREVHDFWHVLFGLPTNLIGETALKVIEFEQMFLPMCMLSVIGGSARFSEKQRRLFFQHYFPWATKAGVKATDLMSVYYEKHFHEDLQEVRRNWGIVPCPDPKATSSA
ncbi:unnamed protein product [Triticum turgidum subsp. durum]|uniref:Ubiquinone biosynthesis protein COQ4 homolog, mitochondrial n=1 Tax=Triticum turgidum subsp. durum TaxID=4567 RepID=A0A9R1P8H1_TRITD|nr:unnamed protein product [Triticum turgidum subsp. durum]